MDLLLHAQYRGTIDQFTVKYVNNGSTTEITVFKGESMMQLYLDQRTFIFNCRSCCEVEVLVKKEIKGLLERFELACVGKEKTDVKDI